MADEASRAALDPHAHRRRDIMVRDVMDLKNNNKRLSQSVGGEFVHVQTCNTYLQFFYLFHTFTLTPQLKRKVKPF